MQGYRMAIPDVSKYAFVWVYSFKLKILSLMLFLFGELLRIPRNLIWIAVDAA